MIPKLKDRYSGTKMNDLPLREPSAGLEDSASGGTGDIPFPETRRVRGPSRVSVYHLFADTYDEAQPGEHLWKDIPEEGEEHFRTEDDDEKKTADPSKHCVVAIGTTGTGKSSVIRFFCGDTVEVSHGTKSHTKGIDIFDEVGADANPKRMWMDTQGTDDSGLDDSDEKILKKIFKKLYENKQRSVKVIWCVSGDMARQKGEYRRQANFIAGLGVDSASPGSIFESTVIIRKMGMFHPKMKHMRGLLDAAVSAGASWGDGDADDYMMGFKGIDLYKSEEDDTYQTLMESEAPMHKMKLLGYLTSSHMKEAIKLKLDSIPAFEVVFQDKRCYKCSLRGDPRYIYNKCHHTSKTKHLLHLEAFHPKSAAWRHILGTYCFHPGKQERVHTGDKEWYHTLGAKQVEVRNPDKGKASYKHPGDFQDGGCCSGPPRYSCCDNPDEAATGCEIEWADMDVRRYECCGTETPINPYEGQETDVVAKRGCTERYACCKANADLHGEKMGCLTKWDCCGEEVVAGNENGCAVKYKCCERDVSEEGCVEQFECCDLPVKARGCSDRYQCCKQAPDSKGCIVVCNHCDVRWGHLPGCCWPNVMDDGLYLRSAAM